MNLADRVREIRQLGVELIAPLSFTPEVAKLSAQQFASLLKEYLKMRGLVIGPDFALGKGRRGNAEKLTALGREMGFFVHNVPPLRVNNEVVSSTLVRQTLARGDMAKVKELMGRPFSITARVVSGDRRGKTLGFPTANFEATGQQLLPPNGVYASITHINGKKFAAATNIGVRPTFGNGKKTVETAVIDYQGELYDKELKVEFIQKLREEERFASPQELKAQIERDINQTRTILTGELK
jgi:riboflavin kinase/FMN adenylyltransferase